MRVNGSPACDMTALSAGRRGVSQYAKALGTARRPYRRVDGIPDPWAVGEVRTVSSARGDHSGTRPKAAGRRDRALGTSFGQVMGWKLPSGPVGPCERLFRWGAGAHRALVAVRRGRSSGARRSDMRSG